MAAAPSCQDTGSSATAMAAGSSTAVTNGVSRFTASPTSSGPVAAIACRAVAVLSALNHSSRTSGN